MPASRKTRKRTGAKAPAQAKKSKLDRKRATVTVAIPTDLQEKQGEKVSGGDGGSYSSHSAVDNAGGVPVVAEAEEMAAASEVLTQLSQADGPGGIQVRKLKAQENELSGYEEAQLGGEWANKWFRKYKMMTKKMWETEAIGGRMLKEAYERMNLVTREDQRKKEKAIVAVMKAKFNRSKDYFVDCIKQAVLKDGGTYPSRRK